MWRWSQSKCQSAEGRIKKMSHTHTHTEEYCWAMKKTPCHSQKMDKLRDYHGEGDGTPLQCSCLENPMDRGAWWAAVHGVARSWTWLSDFTFTFHFPALEKEMATHSSVLAWRIPGTGKPGGLLSVGSHRVGHDWSDSAAAAAAAEIIMLSELSQRKDKYHMISLICRI